MPSWMVAPSSAKRATCSPIRTSASSWGRGAGEPKGSSTSTARSIHASGISLSPKVKGMWGFIWATTRPPRARTRSMAAGRMLTSMPSDRVSPRGTEVCSSTASTGADQVEQAGHEREPHRQVLEPGVVAHARAHEGGLADEAVVLGEAGLGVECEHPAPFEGRPQRIDQHGGRGEIPRDHHPRFVSGKGAEPPGDHLDRGGFEHAQGETATAGPRPSASKARSAMPNPGSTRRWAKRSTRRRRNMRERYTPAARMSPASWAPITRSSRRYTARRLPSDSLRRISSGPSMVPMATIGTPRCLRLFMASAPS